MRYGVLSSGRGERMQSGRLKRREFITLLGGAAAWPLAATAQQAKPPHIGFLAPGRSEFPDAALKTVGGFLQGLQDLGYRDGENIVIEHRFAEWNLERLREFAAEMAHQAHALFSAAQGAVAAYARITGETWKPYERHVEAVVPAVSRQAAAAQLSAFDR